jgi:signal transduction histidine kinase
MNNPTFTADCRADGRDPDCEWRLETLGMVAEGVAHDFNNILAAISGFAELILAGESGDKRPEKPERTGQDAIEFARHILDAAMAGRTSVQELRAFSRPDRNATEPLDLNEVLRQSITLCRGALGGIVRVRTELSSAPARLQGCRGLLQNAFLNLFINARDAMPKGGTLTVRSRLREPSDAYGHPEWVVSIRDTGTGIGPEARSRLFERYFTTKGEKGSGLGLAQVQDTVARYSGRITVESEPGAGSEFHLHFPVDRPD